MDMILKLEKRNKTLGVKDKRLAIARALYFEPQILIFDESTSSLDIKQKKPYGNNYKIYRC